MHCPKCQAVLDSPTRKLCVTCIADAIRSTGEHTHMQAVHESKLRQRDYARRNGKTTGQTWWK
jgi:hypothetical protein